MIGLNKTAFPFYLLTNLQIVTGSQLLSKLMHMLEVPPPLSHTWDTLFPFLKIQSSLKQTNKQKDLLRTLLFPASHKSGKQYAEVTCAQIHT